MRGARSLFVVLVIAVSGLVACVEEDPSEPSPPAVEAPTPSKDVEVPKAFFWPPPGHACFECDPVITCAWTCASGTQGYTTSATSEDACKRACRSDCGGGGIPNCLML